MKNGGLNNAGKVSYDRFLTVPCVSLVGRRGYMAVLIDSVARLSHEDGRICFFLRISSAVTPANSPTLP